MTGTEDCWGRSVGVPVVVVAVVVVVVVVVLVVVIVDWNEIRCAMLRNMCFKLPDWFFLRTRLKVDEFIILKADCFR